MKIVKLITRLSVPLFFTLSAQAQGTFQNLDFERANPVVVVDSPNYPFTVTAASALPYWTVTIGGVLQTQIMENDYSLGAPAVTLLGPGHEADSDPIDGNYSVLLQSTVSAASISQTGVIPVGAQSLLFEAQPPAFAPFAEPLELLVGAQVVSFTAVGTGPNYTLYGADISAWSGQSEELTFSAPADGYDNWEIDDISFSPEAVPEPGILSLLLLGGWALTARRCRAKSS